MGEAKTPGKTINHAVEFQDDEGGSIMNRDRKKPLDLRAHTKRLNKHTGSGIFTVTTVVKTSITRDTRIFGSWVFQEKGVRNPLNNPTTSMNFDTLKITIVSESILNALRNVILYYPDLDLRNDRVTLTSPYAALGHHLDSLRLYRDSLKYSEDQRYTTATSEMQTPNYPPDHQVISTTCNATAAQHLTHLLDYLESSYGERIHTEKSKNDKGYCTFAMLWLLYKPGTTVYFREKQTDLPSAMVIKSVKADPSILFRNDNERSPYELELWNLDQDGRKVGRRVHVKDVEQFHGERAITSLEIFPAHFLDTQDNGRTRNAVIERGKSWYSLIKGKMMMYDGTFQGERLTKPVSI